jgi:hypothetical protein
VPASGAPAVWGIHDTQPDDSGRPSGCGFYRIVLPLRTLKANGWDTRWQAGTPPPESAPYRLVVGERLDRAEAQGHWRRLRARHRLVYEIDDDVFHVDPTNHMAYRVYGQPGVQDVVSHLAATSDLVTVTTEPLAEVMREHNPNVAVLPNCVPGWLCDHPRPRNTKPVVGWTGGASHTLDIAMIAETVREFMRTRPDWDLHIVGTDFRPTLHLLTARFTRWEPDPEDYYRKLDFDIGLCPLTGSVFDAGKCIDSGMRISTDQGVLEAGSIEPGIRVWLDGWREVRAVEHQLQRAGLRITTVRGLQVTVTPEHRLMNGSGEWRQSRDLSVGDALKLVREECPELPYRRAPWPADGRVTRAGAANPMAFLDVPEGPSVAITETWGRILGLFTGDGSFSGKTSIRFSCDGQDGDLIKSLIADLESAGFRATTERVTTWKGQVLRRRPVNVSSAHLSRFLCGIGAARPHSRTGQRWERTLRVPDVIFRSPLTVRAAFLAGLFEADGTAARQRADVTLTTKSEDLARDVQRLLWSIGISSGLGQSRGPKGTKYEDRIYWSVRLRSAEAELFAAHVGFLSERKQTRLAETVNRSRSRNQDRSRQRPNNARRPIRWADEIASIEPCMVCPVDIQVDGEAFSAAGIHSHNSAIKAQELGALGIPVIASDVEAYRGYVVDGVTGFLVSTPKQWRARLRELAGDEALRESMGAKARELARQHTIEGNWQRWADAYTPLL